MLIEILLIIFQLVLKLSFVNNGKERDNKGEDNESSDEMGPDVDSLIMEDEETFEYLCGLIEIEPVAIGDVLVESHEFGHFI